MFRPEAKISLIFWLYPEMQSIRPIQGLILEFHQVISISFHLDMLSIYYVAALLFLLEWLTEKFSRHVDQIIHQSGFNFMVSNLYI